ncbi:hypothetical protein LINPERHAP1_LOCUS41670 [Linum perenne]
MKIQLDVLLVVLTCASFCATLSYSSDPVPTLRRPSPFRPLCVSQIALANYACTSVMPGLPFANSPGVPSAVVGTVLEPSEMLYGDVKQEEDNSDENDDSAGGEGGGETGGEGGGGRGGERVVVVVVVVVAVVLRDTSTVIVPLHVVNMMGMGTMLLPSTAIAGEEDTRIATVPTGLKPPVGAMAMMMIMTLTIMTMVVVVVVVMVMDVTTMTRVMTRMMTGSCHQCRRRRTTVASGSGTWTTSVCASC